MSPKQLYEMRVGMLEDHAKALAAGGQAASFLKSVPFYCVDPDGKPIWWSPNHLSFEGDPPIKDMTLRVFASQKSQHGSCKWSRCQEP